MSVLCDYDLVPSSPPFLEGMILARVVDNAAPVSGRCTLHFSLIIVRKLENARFIPGTSLLTQSAKYRASRSNKFSSTSKAKGGESTLNVWISLMKACGGLGRRTISRCVAGLIYSKDACELGGQRHCSHIRQTYLKTSLYH